MTDTRAPVTGANVRRTRAPLIHACALAVAGALAWVAPLDAFALGLGKIRVQSALSEPLKAEIEFTAWTDKELQKLKATLASPADFDAVGIERAPVLSKLRFSVSRRADGTPVLHVSSEQAVEEPLLHFLIQVEWAGGRLVREYAALIDPPRSTTAGNGAPVEAPAIRAPEAAPAEVAPAPLPSAEPTAAQPAPVAEKVAPATGKPEPVAEKVAPVAEKPAPVVEKRAPVVSATSVAAGGYRVRNGDSLWKIAGKLDKGASATTEQAMIAIFQANPEAFYRKNANHLKSGSVLELPDAARIAAVDPAEATKALSHQYAEWQDYRLKISKASQDVAVAPPAGAVKAPAAAPAVVKAPDDAKAQELLKIVRSEPKAASKPEPEKAAADAGAKTGRSEQERLAERVTTLEESLESKALEHKELESRAGQVTTQLKTEEKLLNVESEMARVAGAEAENGVAAKPAASAQESATAEDEAESTAEEGVVAKLLGGLKGGMLMPVLLALVTVASGGIALLYLHRRRKSAQDFEESILQSGYSKEISSTGSEFATEAVTATEEMTVTAESAAEAAAGPAEDVDPIAEADVYQTYGRTDMAEQILRDAMARSPERLDIRFKLLEVLHQRSDGAGFERVAEEVYASLGGQPDGRWSHIEEMAHALGLEHPMFGVGGSVEAVPAERNPEVASLPDPGEPKSGESVRELNPDDLEIVFEPEGEPAPDSALAEVAIPEQSTEEPPVADADTGGIQAEWDENATKLDLARAYIDMGDSEGARSILDEVLAEGSERQKEQARILAAQLDKVA